MKEPARPSVRPSVSLKMIQNSGNEKNLFHQICHFKVWPKCCSDVCKCKLLSLSKSVWPDWAIYYTLGNFLKPLETINLPKPPTFLGNFCKGVKSIIFLVKSFLGNIYRNVAIFFRSHCSECSSFEIPYFLNRTLLTAFICYGVVNKRTCGASPIQILQRNFLSNLIGWKYWADIKMLEK